jgi:hydroxymethylglutaryl-CoA lyase
MLAQAGINDIEVTSFVNPKAVPQHRDAELLLSTLPPLPGVKLSALVGNVKGVERALNVGVKSLVLAISASETHNLRNVNKSKAESLKEIKELAQLTHVNGVALRGTISATFGCPYEGKVSIDQVSQIIEVMLAEGIQEIGLADTAGLGNPLQVYQMTKELQARFPATEWSLHIHDTKGLGLANILAGLQAGIRIVETSVGGLGGCPFIRRATGNVVTEDAVYMLTEMGIKTDVDLAKVIEAASFLADILGRKLPSKQLDLCRN